MTVWSKQGSFVLYVERKSSMRTIRRDVRGGGNVGGENDECSGV